MTAKAESDDHYRQDEAYQAIINAHHIKVSGSGFVDISYTEARNLLERDDLLNAVQLAYAGMLREGEKPEFVVEEVEPSRWSYMNKSGHRSDLIELHRRLTPSGEAILVYYAEGRRFFGDFRSITEIHVTAASESSCRYEIVVYAYPVNSFSRFFARHLGVVERYFRAKTEEITDLTVKICRILIAANPSSPESMSCIDS